MKAPVRFGRPRVYRWGYRWVAVIHRKFDMPVWEAFGTWREAYDWARTQARS